ncbi:ATP-binding cassette domain-containing protein [Kingella potus]
MDYYKRIIEWAAVVERLAGFQTALDEADKAQRQPEAAQAGERLSDSAAGRLKTDGAGLHKDESLRPSENNLSDGLAGSRQPPLLDTANLCIHTAAGSPLLQNLTLAAPSAQWLLLDGRSGIGKTTLMRTLAGLWPYYRGSFRLGSPRVLFLPQRPYLPQDSLHNLVCYPDTAPRGANEVQAALEQVGLGRLDTQLHSEDAWHKILSGGEQQRISLARALLARPDILFLDEATNQLDDASAVQLLSLLKRSLPDTLVVGISHQMPVKDLFDRRADLGAFAAEQQPQEAASDKAEAV